MSPIIIIRPLKYASPFGSEKVRNNTLIELIEASYAVFERYGAGPSEDAEYHRYLLSLSIDPERDWQKKIGRFALKDQPRIRRQYQLGREHGREPSSSDGANAAGALSPLMARVDGARRPLLAVRNVSDLYQHQSQGSDSSTRQRHHHHKQHSDSEREITQRHDRGNTRACLSHWRKCMRNAQSVQAATMHCNQRLLQGAFAEWKQLIATDQVVLRFYVRATQSRAMTRWKQHVASRRESNLKTQSAECHHQTWLLKLYWRYWRAQTQHIPGIEELHLELSEGGDRLSLSQLEASPDQDGDSGSRDRLQAEEDPRLVSIAIALAQKARFFQRFEIEWDLETSWQRWRHIFHARLFYRMRKLHAHFTIWRSWSDRSRRVRWVVHKFQEKRSALSIINVFRGWKHVVQSVKKLQQQRIRDRELWTIVNTEMIRKERKCVKSHWRAWKFYVEEKRHLRTSLEMYHRARIVTKYWLVWTHDFMRGVRYARAKSQLEKQHMTKFYKRRALQSLQINQQWRKRARLVLEYFSNRDYDTTLPQILKHWRSLVKKSKRVRKLCRAMQWRWLMRAFHTWNDWKCDQRSRKTRVLALMSRCRQAALDSIWLRWRQFAAKRLAKAVVYTKCTRHYLVKCIRSRWYQRVRDRKTLELKIARGSEALLIH